MNDRAALLKAIAERPKTDRYGITTADSYLASLAGCFEGGYCPRAMQGVSSQEWAAALKEAEQKLTYCEKGMNVKGTFAPSYEGSLIEFECVVTTTRKDRDGDILETAGAFLDPAAPLLWQHDPFHVLGRVLRQTEKTPSKMTARCAVAAFDGDGELAQMARDAATLIEFNALRISHGFDPKDYEPLDEKDGRYRIRAFDVLEVSLVSIPSNVSAVITAFSRNKLHSAMIKGWAQKSFDNRPAQAPGVTFETKTHDCTCGKSDVPVSHVHFRTMCSCGELISQCRCIGEKETRFEHQGCTACRAKKEEKSDPIRWNKSFSKRFDVSSADLNPSSTEYGWASKYLEVPVKNIFEISIDVPSARMGSWLTAFQTLTRDFHVEDMRNIQGSSESPPVYETIQLNSKTSAEFLIEGTTFYQEKNRPLIVGIRPTWFGCRLTAYSRLVDSKFVTGLFDKTWQLAKEQNFLKGEAFSLSGEFIPRDNINWSDVFLTEKNQKPLVRMVNNLNAKQAQCPNRGMILMGEPGTGKTLSGRVIKNLAHATFIWISARDFHRTGAFGGFEYAFDLAKELAPCVLFFEDIDNWIRPEVVDLMKTEMDGLTKTAGIITILTTNFPETLPEALVDRPGRFHEILKIGLPVDEIRKAMISKWVPGISEQQIVVAVNRTKGYSGAHIYELAQFAKAITETDELHISEALTKALDKIDEQRDMISRSLLLGSRYQPRKDIDMSTKSPETLVGPANTGVPSTDRMNSETQIPQMAQQGDSEWPGRHPSSMVRDESLVGVDDFDVSNTANDAIMAIAMGGMSGPQQNPSSAATDLSMRPGPMNQSGVPTPTSGVQFPMSMQGTYDPGTSPGPQGSRAEPSLSQSVQGPKEATPTVKDANVNSGYVNYEQQCPSSANVTQAVTPLDRDSAAAHNVGGTLITAVTVNKPPEINGLPNVGKDPLIGKRLLNLKGRIEYLFKVGAITNSEHQKILAVGYASLMMILKDYNLDPVGNGMSATLPANNVLNQPSLGNFTSVPGNNSLNSSSRTGWQGSTPPSPGLPAENTLNQPSMTGMGQPMQPNTPASNPPTGGKSTQGFIGTTPDEDVLNKPRTDTQPAGQRVATDGTVHERRIDPNIRENVADPNISGSLAYGYNVQDVRSNILNENEVMEWLDAAGAPKSHAADLEKEFDEMFVQEFEAKEFDEMFAK